MKNKTLKKVLKRGVAYLLSVLVVITMMINPISAKAATITYERYLNVPYIDQKSYPNTVSGTTKNVADSGCSVTCMTMAYKYYYGSSYQSSSSITPEVLFKQMYDIGQVFPTGVGHDGISQLSPYYGMTCTWTSDLRAVVSALKNGKPVIFNVGSDSNAANPYNFTSDGHYILLTGVREYSNGLIEVYVKDPNGYNNYRGTWMALNGSRPITQATKFAWCGCFGIMSKQNTTYTKNVNMATTSIKQGNGCSITGNISYNCNIGEIHAAVYDSSNRSVLATGQYLCTQRNFKKSYDLSGSVIDNGIRFGTLSPGTYTLHVSAFGVTGTNAFTAIQFKVTADGFITFSTTPSMQTTSIRYGSSCNIYGVVSSSHNITSLTGKVYKTSNTKTPYLQASWTPNAKTVNIATSAVNKNLKFGSLPRGSYYLVIEAKNSAGKTISKKIAFSVR